MNTEILNFVNFIKILAKNFSKKAKLKDKTQNSRKKLKLPEDFSAPERPSDVKTKACPTATCCVLNFSCP